MNESHDSNEDVLSKIFRLQNELATMMDAKRYPDGVEERVSALCTAIIHEVIELQRTTNWKWWKKQTEFNKSEAQEELIDVWHFVVQATIELGMTPKDILAEYERKHAINVKRQNDGY